MGLRVAVACFSFLLCVTLRDGAAQQDIGLAYRDYPRADCVSYEGFTEGTENRFTVLTAKCPAGYETWLSKATKTEKGATRGDMIVLDHMRISELKADERFSPGPYCNLGGKEINWIAIYTWDSRKSMTVANGKLHQAWIANLGSGRFEEVPRRHLETAVCKAE